MFPTLFSRRLAAFVCFVQVYLLSSIYFSDKAGLHKVGKPRSIFHFSEIALTANLICLHCVLGCDYGMHEMLER